MHSFVFMFKRHFLYFGLTPIMPYIFNQSFINKNRCSLRYYNVFILMLIEINFKSFVHVFKLCIYIILSFIALSINDHFFSLQLSCVTHWLRVEMQSGINNLNELIVMTQISTAQQIGLNAFRVFIGYSLIFYLCTVCRK